MLKLLTVAFSKRNQLEDFTYLHLVDLGLALYLHVLYICTISEEIYGSERPLEEKMV